MSSPDSTGPLEQRDLDRYLARIGQDGDRSPTLATLQAVVARQTEAIAFENLTPLTAAPVLLGPGDLQDKLVARRRGGYCYELNLLTADVLRTLGYAVTPLAARVVWNRPETDETPRNHLLLRVDLPEGPHLVDTGFGGLTLTGVLRLEAGPAQATPHEPFRLQARGDAFVLQAEIGGSWRSLYLFDLQPQLRVDAAVGNWYTSTHPDSLFVNHLLAGRPTAERRYALSDNVHTVHHRGGPSEQTRLTTVAEIEAVLERDFLLDLSGIGGLRAALARFV